MFDFLKRGRLIKRGLASRKTRRRRTRSELMRNLETSPYVKVLIFAMFVGGLAFLVFSGKQPEPTKNFLIALLVLATAITQLWINQPKSFSQNSRILLVFAIILVQLAVTKLLLVICNSGNYRFLKSGNGRIDHTLRVCAARVKCVTRPTARPLCRIFREPMEQHVVWSN